MSRWWLALALACAAPVWADSNLPSADWADRQLPNPGQEAAARRLMDEIRCLVCQGQSVSDSDAELAGDMRALIRSRIAAGERPDSIRKWLIQRYGDWISYRPTAAPVTWPLWLAPLAMLAAGLLIIRRRIRMRRAG
ncbi:cytochrome c-type biogenesis protein CcmH [Sphingomonas piscis]|uniref:Cytochrome c-type biogenesis protein n=1 Tax=Sphingomonas piscis TaxID=2714943 RepID=A0A6G7YSV6_9SPHN|nr:cytochrome c-type biogenesis protein [Sphingomonas piscis]QIK79823.1 cytochrome c-type biogenesis protein CcmH [Sphingomonas piscis]